MWVRVWLIDWLNDSMSEFVTPQFAWQPLLPCSVFSVRCVLRMEKQLSIQHMLQHGTRRWQHCSRWNGHWFGILRIKKHGCQSSGLCICMYLVYCSTSQCQLDELIFIFGVHFHKWAKFHLNIFAINCHVDRISWQRRCLSKLWERLPWGERPAQQRLTNRGTSWVLQDLLVRRRQMGQHHLITANVSG